MITQIYRFAERNDGVNTHETIPYHTAQRQLDACGQVTHVFYECSLHTRVRVRHICTAKDTCDG